MLDPIYARLGAGNGVPSVTGDAHAKLMGFVGDHRDQIGRDEFAELDPVVAILLFLPHDRARRLGVRDFHIAAPSARAFSLEVAFARTQRLASGPDSRSANLAHIGALFLRQRPG